MEPSAQTQVQTAVVPQATSLVPGGRWNRFVAGVIDNFLLGLAETPVLIIAELLYLHRLSLDTVSMTKSLEQPIALIMGLAIWAAYKIGLLYQNEATPGKIWRKLKVVRSNDYQRIGLKNAIVRELTTLIYNIPLLGSLLYLISALMFLFSKSRRVIHDYTGGTIVVKNE